MFAGTLREFAEEICNKVRAAAQARVRARTEQPTPAAVPPKYSADAVIPASAGAHKLHTTERIIAIGASTGGTEAIRVVLQTHAGRQPGGADSAAYSRRPSAARSRSA